MNKFKSQNVNESNEPKNYWVKPTFLIIILFFVVYLILYGCTGRHSSFLVGSQTYEGAYIRIAVVPKCITMPFWNEVREGAIKAGGDFGVEILWKGTESEDDIRGQIRIIESFISQGINAIVFAACDADALIEPAKVAKQKGITIITFDSGISGSEIPSAYVATDNVQGGRIAANKLAELVGRKGRVGLISFVQTSQSSAEREMGFREAIASYPDITLAFVLSCESSIEKACKVTREMLNAQANISGICAVNQVGSVGAAQIIKELGLVGQVKLVGFDYSEDEINALREGVIQALIVQDPFNIGYEGVKAAVDVLIGKPVKKRINTNLSVFTTEEINQPLP